MMSASFIVRIMRMILWTVSDPLATLNHQRELHRRSTQGHSRRSRLILCAIDNIRPVDQFLQVRCIEAELFLGERRNVFRAGPELRVVHLMPAGVAQEVLVILRRQKRALMMIEPPVEFRIGGVLEIDNRIHVAVEQLRLKSCDALCARPVNSNWAPGWNFASINRLKKAAEAAPSKQWS